MKPKLSVAALHGDGCAREAAVRFCDQLVQRFWAECDIEVHWLPFRVLADEMQGADAAPKAAEADLILFAANESIPAHVQGWIRQCLLLRNEREGILVALSNSEASSSFSSSEAQASLREMAHRAGMDYLTGIPQSIRRFIPESLESVAARAHEVTNLLDEILHHTGPPRSPGSPAAPA